MTRVILASGSPVRAELLRRVGLVFDVEKPRVDEASVKAALEAEAASPREIADALAELKAIKVSAMNTGVLVLGCDQVLAHDGRVLSKAASREEAAAQLRTLAGSDHRLITAAVIAENGHPIWRVVTEAQLWMKPLTEARIEGYLERNWPGIGDCVGVYRLEDDGPRLFQRISGDYFTILGLPLLEICSYLEMRGEEFDA